MTAVKDLSARPAEAPRLARSRPALYAATILLVVANAAADKAIEAVQAQGPWAALVGGLGASWALWFACAAAVGLALREPPAPVRPRDLWVCAAGAAAALAPVSQFAAVATAALAAAMLLDRGLGRDLKAAAMVLAAMSLALLWSRLLLLFFMAPLAHFDASLVGLVIGRPIQGAYVPLVHGEGRLAILAACTSVQNVAVAAMLYVAIVRCFRPEPKVSEAWALAGVGLSVVVLNTARLTAMAQSEAMYHLVHGDTVSAWINVAVMLTGLAWAVASVRREIFP